jgi:branched-chain amino acid transport system permease protein
MQAFFDSFAWITNPTVILRQSMAGIANGMLLFLVASGLSLIFGVTRVINFAHGTFFMLGAYLAFTVVGSSLNSWSSFLVMLAVATAGMFFVGILFEVCILRRIYRSAQAFQLLVTFALVLIAGDAVLLIWGNADNSMSLLHELDGFVRLFGVSFPVYRLFLIGVGSGVCLLLWLLLYRSRWGVMVRAATVDRDMLGALGVNVGRVFSLVFGLGSALAGLAGGLAAPIVSIGPGLHGQVLTDALVIVAIGGLGSFSGSFVGALLVGEANAFGILAFPQMAIVVPFLLMMLVLIARPRGLFGRPE